jgi:hypothetical protein
VTATSEYATVTSWGSAAERPIVKSPPPCSSTVASATDAFTHVSGRSHEVSFVGRVSAMEFQLDVAML